ncbi:MAG: hypothetical protein IKW45_04860 [Clostridia bacterium]|nr:hypothetical protein [Clostridia bacterium]
MSAFREGNNFATEFALRTLVNCYRIYEFDRDNFSERERRKIESTYDKVRDKVQQNNYTELEVCFGTQLMNSILGLLVFPQQQFWDEITKSKSETVWYNLLPSLAKYVFSDNPDIFKFDYSYWSKKRECYVKEDKTVSDILRHMKNSVSHKRISLYPQGVTTTNEVEFIVFEDQKDDNGIKSVFKLKIEKDDLLPILLEISEYFVNIDEYKERIKTWR